MEMELREQLAYLGQRNVRIFNLAMPAHTSRDSWLKYAALRDARFDLVIFYHGINEARVNNAPPEYSGKTTVITPGMRPLTLWPLTTERPFSPYHIRCVISLLVHGTT